MNTESAPDAAGKKKISIKVWGVGGAGCNAVAALEPAILGGVELLALNTDAQALEASPVPEKFVLGWKRTKGMGAGGEPEVGRAAAEDDLTELSARCGAADVVIILCGLGGGTGTGASPVLARMARERGALVLAFAMLPFEFQGRRCREQAEAGLQNLKLAADAVICLPNQKLFQLLDEKTGMSEAFKTANALLANGLYGIWRLLTRTGHINVDFADLCSVTRGRHAVSSFATAEAGGERRAEQIMEKLLAHPLLDGGQVLAGADALLVSVTGGHDVTLVEVNKLMESINRQCENATITFGFGVEEQFAGRMSVSLIASCPPQETSNRRLAERFTETSAPQVPPVDLSGAGLRGSAVVRPPVDSGPFAAPESAPAPRGRKRPPGVQAELPLSMGFKGRFEQGERNIRRGEDLDVPTYVRRGLPLN